MLCGFNEGTGLIAYDLTEYEHHGTFWTSADWVPGVNGTAIYLDGTAGHALNFGTDNAFNFVGENFTVAFWLNVSTTSGNKDLVAKWVGGTGWAICIVGTLPIMFVQHTACYRYSSLALTANEWNHIVYVQTAGSKPDCYINGTLRNGASSGSAGSSSSYTNLIMGYSGVYGVWANATYDDFRLYNRALTSTEVSELYALNGYSSYTAPEIISSEDLIGLIIVFFIIALSTSISLLYARKK